MAELMIKNKGSKIMQVSIIIVNYNTKDLTLNCIKSIYQQTKDIEFEIIVVDNASSDGSMQAIREHFPQVILIEAGDNIGFGRANNLGVKSAKSEFLFLLNSDTLFVENSLKKLYDFYKLNQAELDLGVLGCFLINENGVINGFGDAFPNVTSIIESKIKAIPFIDKLYFRSQPKTCDFNKLYFEVDYVLGADMFLSKKLFKVLNGFDERYFMYFEESDLQLKVRELGLHNFIYTGTKIVHLEGKSFKEKISNFKRKIVHKSEISYIKKNYSESYSNYLIIDILWLSLSAFNSKYTFSERKDYIITILKEHMQR